MLGKAFGVNAMTIAHKSEIEPVLKEALSCGKPVLIECKIDRDINVLPMVPPGGSIAEPILELD